MGAAKTKGVYVMTISKTAAQVMTRDVAAIRADATIAEAMSLLTESAVAAAPVVDDKGLPIGVVSRTDLLVHAKYQSADGGARGLVRDVMTPGIFAVKENCHFPEIIAEMVDHNVLQVFVVAPSNKLVGHIGALDILRAIRLGERPSGQQSTSTG
jgi:predicted transcriptional regulator